MAQGKQQLKFERNPRFRSGIMATQTDEDGRQTKCYTISSADTV